MSGKKAAVTHVMMILGMVMALVTIAQLQVLSTWSPTGFMSQPRGFSVATLLPDGRVLDTGGWGYSVDYPGNATPVSGAELYDPRLGTWTPTAAMSTPRGQHTVSLLRDGRVLVTGGMTASSILASAEIYNPALGTWSPTSSMPTSRYYHAATVLPDGRVLITGGVPALQSAEIYDPALGTWSSIPAMSTPRLMHTATLLQDGRVLVSGGLYDTINTTDSVEIYDPALGTWFVTGSMTADRTGHAATLLSDGRVLVSGGYSNQSYEYYDDNGIPVSYTESSNWQSAEIYDPVSGTWSPTGSMRAGSRYWHPSTLLSDGRVLVSGGGSTYADNPVFATAEIYNPATGTWALTAPMLTPRWGLTATSLPDGRVLVSGGFGRAVPANTILASAEIYSPGPPPPEDTTPPRVSCAASDGAWHNNDVTIACTASDAGSGLATSADVTFNLTTSVPGMTETGTAETNSRQVCDTEGNCNTAGPVAGNKVDKKAPTIAIASPAVGATYGVNAKVAASYSCSDGGSGMTSCAGPVANGSSVNTSSKGTKTFTVTATDRVGNSSVVSVTYSVVPGRK